MLPDTLLYLRCPVCAEPLSQTGQTVHCPRRHSFDLARQGYLPLTGGRRTHPGDSAEMVAARQAWLSTGGYDFVSAALVAAVGTVRGLVLDVGAGTGHHLARVLAARPGTVGLALDVAKPALRRAARAHPRATAVLADTWRQLPVADQAAAVLLNVFAPRHGREFHRVLRPDGVLLVVTPTPAHLAELVHELGLLQVDPEKPDRVAASLAPWFRLAGTEVHTRRLELRRPQARDLIAMGPNAHHHDPDALAARLPEPFSVTAAIRLSCYRPAGPGTGRQQTNAQVERSISSQPRGCS